MALPAPVGPPGSCQDWALWAPQIPGYTCSTQPPNRMGRQDCHLFGTSSHPGAFHMVCGSCYNLSWGVHVGDYDNIVSCSPIGTPTGAAHPASNIPASNIAWPPLPAPGTSRFGAFWTRLCSACERIEQDKFEESIASFTGFMPAPAPGQTPPADMWDYPRNTCGCLIKIGWPANLAAPPAPAAAAGQPPVLPVAFAAPWKLCQNDHQTLVANLVREKNNNDMWLRNLSRTADGRLCLASAATKRRRDHPKSSSHRACRCGADVDTLPHQAKVLLCMGCNGLRCLIRRSAPASRYQNTPTRPRRNITKSGPGGTSRGIGDMTLGRETNQFYDTRAR